MSTVIHKSCGLYMFGLVWVALSKGSPNATYRVGGGLMHSLAMVVSRASCPRFEGARALDTDHRQGLRP